MARPQKYSVELPRRAVDEVLKRGNKIPGGRSGVGYRLACDDAELGAVGRARSGPEGRAATRSGRDRRNRGMGYVHSAIDAYIRLAYSEIQDDVKGPTCAEF
jgi:hypothetical protein